MPLVLEPRGGSQDELAYYGEHDLDVQRAYRIICHLYGLDPNAYGDIADDVILPLERRESCAYDYELAQESWEVLLEDE